MNSPVGPSLPGLVERLEPIPEGIPMTTFLIAETSPSTLTAAANDVVVRFFSAELAARPNISNIYANHLAGMRDIVSTEDGRIPARNRGIIEGIARDMQVARRAEAAAARTVRVLAGDKALANTVLNEQRRLSRPMRRAAVLLSGIVLGSAMGGIVYDAQSMPLRVVGESGSQEKSQANEPSQPGDVDYPLVGLFAILGFGSGLTLGGLAGEAFVGRGARFRARRIIRKSGAMGKQTADKPADAAQSSKVQYYPPFRDDLKAQTVPHSVRIIRKQPRPHNMHGSTGRNSHIGRSHGGNRQSKR
jgi:hypothetical protein